MSVKREEIVGNLIKNEIKSSNISRTEYDTDKKTMLVIFNSGLVYKYFDVPHNEYTRFRMSESQGSYFSKNIAKNFKYEKI